MKIYINKRICDYHFKPQHKTYGHRLSAIAEPALHLEGVFKSHITNIETEHNYCIPRMLGYTSDKDHQSTYLASKQHDHVAPTHTIMDPVSQLTLPSTSRNETNRKSPATLLQNYRAAERKIRRLKKDITRANAKMKSFKMRLEEAEKLSHPSFLDKVSKNMTAASKIFTAMQIRQCRKKPKGRRFTVEEKIMALSLFKKSQKAYSLLYRYFTLPSAKSLKNLLGDIKIHPGINNMIFKKLKETVSDWSETDKLCTVIFDEMSLNPQVHYDAKNDMFKGFSTVNQTLRVANHVLVFMIKGIKVNFKQPVAYYFTQSLNKNDLKKCIQEVITNVLSTGLNVICTVCDQSQVNVSAINSLKQDTKEVYLKAGREWRNEFFEIKRKKLIPLYDVPHLLKGLRNNLLNKTMYYFDSKDNKEKNVKWDYFQQLYEADKPNDELTFLHKLTDEHIYPDKIKKMRVKLAAQVFSHSVAVTTEHLTRQGDLAEECRQIIPFVLLIDKLFDSLNSGTFHIPSGKKYRGPVKRGSPHHLLWQEAKKVLKSVKFISKKTVGAKVQIVEIKVPSVNNFILTIEGMQALWEILHCKYSLDVMLTRNFNQDPVKNFFGNIRSLGARNNSPNCVAFEAAYKTLLLNNFNSPHSVNSNCEEDINKCLQSLKFLIKEKDSFKQTHSESLSGTPTNIMIDDDILCNINNTDEADLPNYVCGWVLTKCFKKIKCRDCKVNILAEKGQKGNEYIQAKEYEANKKWQN